MFFVGFFLELRTTTFRRQDWSGPDWVRLPAHHCQPGVFAQGSSRSALIGAVCRPTCVARAQGQCRTLFEDLLEAKDITHVLYCLDYIFVYRFCFDCFCGLPTPGWVGVPQLGLEFKTNFSVFGEAEPASPKKRFGVENTDSKAAI